MTKLFIAFLIAVSAALNAEEAVKAVLFPFREAVIASRVESTLQPYRFRIGELFKKDEIITTLDNADYTLKLNEKKNQLDFAQAVYQDKKELREKNFYRITHDEDNQLQTAIAIVRGEMTVEEAKAGK
jgi:multidrug efflux pump subunit AcrA (membrane-fusion protein)